MNIKFRRPHRFMALLWTACCMASVSAAPYTGGIALDKTAQLAKETIAVPNGNPQQLIALAARHGHAKGRFTGQAAEAVAKRFGKPIPIYIEATDIGEVVGQAGCRHIKLRYYTSASYQAKYADRYVEVAACPNRSPRQPSSSQ